MNDNKFESPAGKWWALFLLTAVYAVNIADRFVASTLIEPIKHEFSLTDSEVGLLTGTALALFYVTLSMPLGILADRVHRKRMIAAALTIWSTFTMFCGMSTSLVTLFLSRLGVGIGEAGSMPASVSLLADRFSPAARGTAMSLFSVGAAIGAYLGATGGGWIADHYGWRTVLLTFGAAGIPLALLVLLGMREPKRGTFDTSDERTAKASFVETLRFIRGSKPLLHVVLGSTLVTFWGWGLLWWTPAFLSRSFHLSTGAAGDALGTIYGIGGTAAMLLTALALRKPKGNFDVFQARLVSVVTVVATIPSVLAYVSNSLSVVMVMLWVFIPAVYVFIGPAISLAQNLAPPSMRGQVIGIIVFTTNVANLVIAPQLLGFLSDVVATKVAVPSESLRYVLAGTALTGFWAAWHFVLAARHVRRREDVASNGRAQRGSVTPA
ncbi:MFS transporter [Pandoraea sputorum]|uniref:spinster family MFS transporter n=1 Tax=Pandoraea sputorum TaxID=93222 RepID=UPI001E5C50AF|nr:MFS transporter [Pandoraea sputorum]MCE4058722.1 MFS transporter [Pandoraea sputorum]